MGERKRHLQVEYQLRLIPDDFFGAFELANRAERLLGRRLTNPYISAAFKFGGWRAGSIAQRVIQPTHHNASLRLVARQPCIEVLAHVPWPHYRIAIRPTGVVGAAVCREH